MVLREDAVRALRGAAFAQGSLFSLPFEGLITDSVFDELRGAVESLQSDILEELRQARGEGSE